MSTVIAGKPARVFAPVGSEPDEKALEQFATVMQNEHAVAGALMADHHFGYSMPIGGVVKYVDAISPSGVGFDIACGNMAVRLVGVKRQDLAGSARGRYWTIDKVMDEISTRISFGMGRFNATPVDHELFDRYRSTLTELDKLATGRRGGALSQKARAQLGTVGGGNHYVDVLYDEQTDDVWVANHFGSRGLGHTLATGAMNLHQGRPFTQPRPGGQDAEIVIPSSSELYDLYLEWMHLAGDYAYAGREYVIEQVLAILSAQIDLTVHNHHNFAWFEGDGWVVRKGATPLTRELAYIGGSMGDGAVIVRGRNSLQLDEFLEHGAELDVGGVIDDGALGSAPHGAGRVMSRTKAAGKVKNTTRYGCPDRDCSYFLTPPEHDAAIREKPHNERRDGIACPEHGKRLNRFRHQERKSEGVIDYPAALAELGLRGVEIRGGGADEAPAVYKDLDAVIAAHQQIEVVHRLRPLGVVMAAPDINDPYKD